MAEILASRAQQVLNDLELKDKSAIEDEVNGLVRVLEKIEDLWTNAHSSEIVSDNMQRLRELAYDIEDLLEMWAVEMDSRKKRGIRWFLKRYVFRRYDMEVEMFQYIGNIYIERFQEMVPDDHAMESVCSVDEEQSVADQRNVSWPWQTYAHDDMVEHFVGMETDLKQLISLVTKYDHKNCVVSIWGAEGLGKTTLARKVYKDVEVRFRFNASAWVTLSQGFQFRNVLQDMLMQLGRGAVKKSAADKNKMNEENMIDQLKEVQRQKRCFIVVDGISDMKQWTDVRSAFLLTNTRVLLTTRLETIATLVGSPHQLKLLSEDEGWELLKKYAFGHGAEAPTSGIIPKFGREMVGKCRNLSEICRIGRILSKTPLSEWHMVNNEINGYLQRDDQSQSDEISADVSQSNNYDQLPYGLKQCFLYLGIFKENEELDSEDLTLLWMAEGMLSPQGKMDTAEQYIHELADRDLLQVQVDEFSANRRFMPLCLRKHKRELSLYEGEKEDFRLKVMDFSDGKQPRFYPITLFTLSGGIRRLVIHFNKLVSSPPQARELVARFYLRSLFFLNSDDKECVDLPVRINDFKEFTLLRVLHFVRCKFKDRKLPEGIEKLVNLRYFGILYCDLDELPPSISKCRNLLVLNVRASDDAKIIIPNVLSQMIRLKHLRLPKKLDKPSSSKPPDKLLELDGLRDLETLVGFNADILDLGSLSRLKKLRLLVIHAYSDSSLIPIINFFEGKGADMQTNLFIEYTCSFTSQKELTNLEEVLMCHDLYALTLSSVLTHKFPNCGTHASSGLTQIKLIGCKLSEDPMGALGQFPSLQKLCLGYGAFLGREMAISCTGFAKLEYLEFRCLPNLEEWKVDVGAMPHLSALTVRRCLKLKGIPKELASNNRDSLNSLEIELPPSALADGQEEEYRQMFDFVKSLSIRKLDPLSSCSKDSHH